MIARVFMTILYLARERFTTMANATPDEIRQAQIDGSKFGQGDKTAGLADDLLGRSLMAHPSNSEPYIIGDQEKQSQLQGAFDAARENEHKR